MLWKYPSWLMERRVKRAIQIMVKKEHQTGKEASKRKDLGRTLSR